MLDDDSFVEVSEKGWFDRLGGSLFGALVGIVLFGASFFLLAWNEWRAVEAIAALNAGAKAVVSVPADRIDPANVGRLVHVSGPATVAGPLVDTAFGVGGANLLRLERRVEMYQWHEDQESTTEKQAGGTETTRTTYRYTKRWSETAVDSSRFKRPDGHANPAMPYRGQTINANPVRLGAFTLDVTQIQQIDAFGPLAPTGGTPPAGFQRDGDYLVRGALDDPRVGDLRVSFRAVPAQTISVVAQQTERGLTTHHAPNGWEIELVRTGAWTADDMFRQAKADERLMTWILRGVGFAMMFLGVVMMTSPLTWLASVLPFLEWMADIAAFGLGLVVAVPLTVLTIALSWLAFRPLIGGGLIVAAVVLAIACRRVAPRRGGFGARSSSAT